MKTVSERKAEFIAVAREVQANFRCRWKAYVEQIAAKDIPVHVGDAVDVTDYESRRREVRAGILAAVSGRDGGFVQTACDHCETALWDGAPNVTLTSNPLRFWADCIGCGKRYPLELEFRTEWLPPRGPAIASDRDAEGPPPCWPNGYYPVQVGGWWVWHGKNQSGASLEQWKTREEARLAAWGDSGQTEVPTVKPTEDDR
jgi:hypothetical protein